MSIRSVAILVFLQTVCVCAFADETRDAITEFRAWLQHGAKYPSQASIRAVYGSADSSDSPPPEAAYWLAVDAFHGGRELIDADSIRVTNHFMAYAANHGVPGAQVYFIVRLAETGIALRAPSLYGFCKLAMESRALAGDTDASIGFWQLVSSNSQFANVTEWGRVKQFGLQAIKAQDVRGFAAVSEAELALKRQSESFQALEAGASAGDGIAAYKLGCWYRDIEIVPDARAEAEKWFLLAVSREVVDAKLELAELLARKTTDRFSLVRAWNLLKEASSRSQKAKLRLAMAYIHGDYGRPTNPTLGEVMLMSLSKRNYAPAHRELGYGYLMGVWTLRDPDKAYFHLNAAALLGDNEARKLLQAKP